MACSSCSLPYTNQEGHLLRGDTTHSGHGLLTTISNEENEHRPVRRPTWWRSFLRRGSLLMNKDNKTSELLSGNYSISSEWFIFQNTYVFSLLSLSLVFLHIASLIPPLPKKLERVIFSRKWVQKKTKQKKSCLLHAWHQVQCFAHIFLISSSNHLELQIGLAPFDTLRNWNPAGNRLVMCNISSIIFPKRYACFLVSWNQLLGRLEEDQCISLRRFRPLSCVSIPLKATPSIFSLLL